MSILSNLPVSAYLAQFQDNNGNPYYAPAALLNVGPPSSLQLAGPPPVGSSFSGTVDVTMSALDLNMAMQLGYGDMFNVNATVSADMWLAAVQNTMTPVQNNTGSAIVNEYWGFAARMIITAYGLKAGTSLDVYGLSAQADVNGIKSSYFIDLIGIPLALQRPMLDLVSFANGNFDESANGLTGSLKSMVSDILADPAVYAQLQPALLAVDIDLSKIPVSSSDLFAYSFSLENIRKNRSQATALQNLSKMGTLKYSGQITADQVGAYYGLLDVTGNPTSTQSQTANASLFQGA
jgi:hypothetical protein